jgi:hypothetical protein
LTDVDGDVVVVRAGRNGKWMPLVVADFWAVEEEPLSGLVLHAGLSELNLNSVYYLLAMVLWTLLHASITVWVADDLDNLGLASAADLSVETVHEVQTAADKLPSPALVTNAVGPEVVVIERGKGRSCVTHEAASGMRVHAKQEWDKQMMRVPEGLERLLSDPVVGCRVHQKHA